MWPLDWIILFPFGTDLVKEAGSRSSLVLLFIAATTYPAASESAITVPRQTPAIPLTALSHFPVCLQEQDTVQRNHTVQNVCMKAWLHKAHGAALTTPAAAASAPSARPSCVVWGAWVPTAVRECQQWSRGLRGQPLRSQKVWKNVNSSPPVTRFDLQEFKPCHRCGVQNAGKKSEHERLKASK